MSLTLPPKVSERAFPRLGAIVAKDASLPCLRVAVDGGGCSGFQYDIKLEAAPAEDDLVIAKDGLSVLIDPVSMPFLAGATIDFSAELIGARFVVQNPNATSSCGCGTSFSM